MWARRNLFTLNRIRGYSILESRSRLRPRQAGGWLSAELHRVSVDLLIRCCTATFLCTRGLGDTACGGSAALTGVRPDIDALTKIQSLLGHTPQVSH